MSIASSISSIRIFSSTANSLSNETIASSLPEGYADIYRTIMRFEWAIMSPFARKTAMWLVEDKDAAMKIVAAK